MYQQSLDLQFPLTQQLSLDLDVPVDRRLKFYVANNLITTIDDVWASGTMSSYLTVNNSDGDEGGKDRQYRHQSQNGKQILAKN